MQLAIVIPAYKPNFLRECLQSIIDQSRKDFCLYIGDDCSSYDLKSIVDEFSFSNPVVYHKFQDNLGHISLTKQWERCIGLTQDEPWIWLFSDDDVMPPDAVERFYQSLLNAKNRTHVFRFNVCIINSAGQRSPTTSDHPPWETAEAFLTRRLRGATISTACEYIFSRNIYNRYGGFVDFPMAWCSDDATWIQFAQGMGFITIQGSPILWRLSNQNITGIDTYKYKKMDAAVEFVQWISNRYKTSFSSYALLEFLWLQFHFLKIPIFKRFRFIFRFFTSNKIEQRPQTDIDKPIHLWRHSNFSANPHGHGGERRTSQISEALSSAGQSLSEITTPTVPRLRSILKYSFLEIGLLILCAISVCRHLHKLHILCSSLRYPRIFTYLYPQIIHFFELARANPFISSNSIFLWESTHIDRLGIVLFFRCKGIPIIGIPHNIESLVPEQASPMDASKGASFFSQELLLFKLCTRTLTISHEDAWLLSLYGIPCASFPYHPPIEICKSMNLVNALRLQESRKIKQEYLLLGSAMNPPTRLGMLRIISTWIRLEIPYTLHIAGYHTETLPIQEKRNHKHLCFHGTVSNEKLIDLLAQVKAVIIDQEPTTGSLTRIPELSLAGIPILMSARCQKNYGISNNIRIFDSDQELLQLLNCHESYAEKLKQLTSPNTMLIRQIESIIKS